MDIQITFPGGKRVDALLDGRLIHTDQPIEGGGEGTAPGAFDLFLASIGACAGIYALGFCQARQIDTTGLAVNQHVELDEKTHLPTRVTLDLVLPADFPERWKAGILKAVDLCKVKRTLAAPPEFAITVTEAAHAG